MTREQQDLIYAFIGKELTKARERKNLTITQLANKVDEQYNTIKAIEDGNRFMFHQAVWMKEVLGMNLNILISDAYNVNSIPTTVKEEHGKEKAESSGGKVDFSDLI